ncbi:MAG TPA: TetR/AcrR family transcriptional regulator [Thermoleophilaceae bacterium]|jgi:AcrR family transcriptional regulator
MADDNQTSGLPASIEASWGLRERPTKGPKPGLTLARIVDAAVEIARDEGLAAVSMARVAKALGVSTMSLYRYVEAKDELLDLMADAAIGPPPARAGEDEGWRAGLERWASGYHDRLREHVWALEVPISGPPTTPNAVAWLEDGLRSLGETGLPEDEKASVVLVLSGYVRSEAILTAGLVAAHGRSDVMSGYAPLLRRLTDPQRFPALHQLLDAGVFDEGDDPDDEFRFGLERILDGVDVLVVARS